MTTIDTTKVQAALGRRFDDEVANQINRSTLPLQLFSAKRTEGQSIEWVARFGTPAGSGALPEGADVTEFNADDRVPAKLEHGDYSEAFEITGKSMSKALAAGNPRQLMDLFLDEMKEAIRRLAKAIARDFYIGTGVLPQMHGILTSPAAIGATGVYAGIDRAVYPQWAAQVLANGGTGRALTIDLMHDMRQRIYDATGYNADLIITTTSIFTKYGKLIFPQRRFVQEVTLGGQRIVLDGGFRALEFDGIPLLQDVDMPVHSATRHRMVFFSSQQIRFEYLPHPSDAVTRSAGERDVVGGAEYQQGEGRPNGLRCRINFLAVNGDKYRFQLIVYPQVRVRSPREFGDLQDLNPAL